MPSRSVPSVAVVSSHYGAHYDRLRFVPQSVRCEHVMVTDGETPIPKGWRTVVERRPHVSPRLAAKVAKCVPERYTDADLIVWIDCSIDPRPTLVEWLLDSLGDADLGACRHPERSCIVDEARVSSRLPKYAGFPLTEQAAHYVREGHPRRWGLWAGGVMVRRRGVWGADWLAEQVRWSTQDQISLPPVVRRHILTVADLPGGLLWNPHFGIDEHAHGAVPSLPTANEGSQSDDG